MVSVFLASLFKFPVSHEIGHPPGHVISPPITHNHHHLPPPPLPSFTTITHIHSHHLPPLSIPPTPTTTTTLFLAGVRPKQKIQLISTEVTETGSPSKSLLLCFLRCFLLQCLKLSVTNISVFSRTQCSFPGYLRFIFHITLQSITGSFLYEFQVFSFFN